MTHIRRTTGRAWIALAVAGLVTACGEEPPPTSVSEFMEKPILLEATMVRCVQNRAEARYDSECRNAREAVDRIAAREEQGRRAELEAQSERKRQALRRAQDAAAEARRRALEEERKRQEAELLGPFAPLPEGATESNPRPSEHFPQQDEPPPAQDPSPDPDTPPSGESEPSSTAERPSELEAVRQELERRQQNADQKL